MCLTANIFFRFLKTMDTLFTTVYLFAPQTRFQECKQFPGNPRVEMQKVGIPYTHHNILNNLEIENNDCQKLKQRNHQYSQYHDVSRESPEYSRQPHVCLCPLLTSAPKCFKTFVCIVPNRRKIEKHRQCQLSTLHAIITQIFTDDKTSNKPEELGEIRDMHLHTKLQHKD